MLVAVGATTAVFGTLAYRRARAALVATTETRLRLLGHDLAQTLHRELMARVVDTTTWARLETMIALAFGDVDKQVADLLGHALGTAEEWVALAARNARGDVVASAGAPDVAGRVVPPDVAAQVVVVPGEHGASLVRIDTPVYSSRREGVRIGTLSAYLDPMELLRRLAPARDRAEGIAIVFNVAGRPVTNVRDPVVGTEARSDGADALRVRVPLPALAGIAGPAMDVVVRQPARIALASVHQLRTTLLAIGALIVLVSGVVGAAVAWRLGIPIRRLTASAQAVAARGRPDPLRVPVRAGGEVGVLADAFGTMLERLAVAEREVITQSRLAALGEVAASVAHDVRTPLSVLKTSAQLLADPATPAAERRDLAAMVSAEVDRLNGVVTRLVDLARSRRGPRIDTPLVPLAQHVVAVLRPWAAARGVAITIDGREDVAAEVAADEVQQAVMNIVHNAVQACGVGGRVGVGCRREGGWAVVDVEDTGPGFSPDALAQAFSPFFTTKPDGTGLGLAVVRRVAEAHEGDAGAANRPEGGARVWLRLPLSRAASSSSPR